MKKLFLLIAAACASLTAAADEGMWLLPYLQKMNIADMRAKGCELSAEEIYAADRSSLKDAIVIFGAGCTGEVVSPEDFNNIVPVVERALKTPSSAIAAFREETVACWGRSGEAIAQWTVDTLARMDAGHAAQAAPQTK